jgi:hypothetical protein
MTSRKTRQKGAEGEKTGSNRKRVIRERSGRNLMTEMSRRNVHVCRNVMKERNRRIGMT